MRRVWVWLIPAVVLWEACGTYRSVPPEPSAAYRRGETAIQSGDAASAVQFFRRFLEQAEDPVFRPRAYYRLAQAHYSLGQHQECVDALNQMEEEFPDERWPQVSALRGDAEFALGHHTDGFLSWEDAWARGTSAEHESLRTRMTGAVDELSDEELRELDELVSLPAVREIVTAKAPTGAPAFAAEEAEPEAPAEAAEEKVAEAPGEVTVEVTTAEKKEAPPGVFRRMLGAIGIGMTEEEQAQAGPPPEAVAAEEAAGGAVEVAEPRPLEAAAGPRVACLLPFTSADRPYGMRALAGLRLAFADSPYSLLVRDTGGEPAVARQLLTRLADDPTVVAVVGPLRSAEAAAVAPAAEQLNMPLALLSQREGLAGPVALQTAMTQQDQVSLLVSHAQREFGAERFGVLYPNDAYGRTFAEAFLEAVRREGGRVVGASAYAPGAPDVDREVGTVRGWHRQDRLDALFIPDGAGVAAVLGAHVRRDLPELALLGTEGWNRPEIIERIGTDIEGAVFTDAFFAGSSRPATRSFVERFKATTGRPPTVFEAQAYDAGMLIRKAMESGATTRDQVRERLSQPATVEGAGVLRSGPTGVRRHLLLLTVREGRVAEVSEASPEAAIPAPPPVAAPASESAPEPAVDPVSDAAPADDDDDDDEDDEDDEDDD